jgi:hypothetical protein
MSHASGRACDLARLRDDAILELIGESPDILPHALGRVAHILGDATAESASHARRSTFNSSQERGRKKKSAQNSGNADNIERVNQISLAVRVCDITLRGRPMRL